MRKEWTEKSVNELAFVGRGKSRHRPRNDPSLYGGEYPFVQTAEIHNADLWITSFQQTYSDRGLAQSKMWEPGTICITNAGENTGDCAILGIRACFPDSIIAVIADEERSDTVFLKYAIDQLRPQLRRITKGATQDNLSVAKLNAFKFPTPPLDEQKRIGAFLRAYGDLIENNFRRIALLEKAARLIYEEWFVRMRFPGHEHTRIVDGAPDGWDNVLFEQALVLQRGFDLTMRQRQDGDIPVYGSTGLNGYHNKAKAAGPGVVTGRSGTLGKVHYVEEDYWPHNTALWVREFKKVTPLFALFLMRGMHLEQYNGGVSVPTLDRKAVHRVPVCVPSLHLLELFDQAISPMFDQMSNLGKQNEKLKQARDLLLPRLMSGEIAV